MPKPARLYLSPPHLGGQEQAFVQEAFDTNWIAPLGPNVNGFEAEFAAKTGAPHACALVSGTAGLHLSLLLAGVEPGDTVVVSDLTFVASVNPIRYVGAEPILVDSERTSWNMDPVLLERALKDADAAGSLPKAVIVVHLYGQCADLDAIKEICDRYDVVLIEDAAEALGASYKGRHPGNDGRFGVFSFNGNKIITTSGGGMLVSADGDAIAHARKLATQARDDAAHYQHTEMGFNYRLSNLCAGVGRGQLMVLDERVAACRKNFEYYTLHLGELPGVTMAPEAEWGMHTRWLSCLQIDEAKLGVSRESIRLALEAENIESRPLWKPMHMQPLYAGVKTYGGEVGRELFETGLCLPSGSSMDDEDRERVVSAFMRVLD